MAQNVSDLRGRGERELCWGWEGGWEGFLGGRVELVSFFFGGGRDQDKGGGTVWVDSSLVLCCVSRVVIASRGFKVLMYPTQSKAFIRRTPVSPTVPETELP